MKKRAEPRFSDSSTIAAAARAIRAGGLVVFPTETVYGLGADALDSGAVRSIFAAKTRPSDNPLIVHLAELDDLERVTSHAPSVARALFVRFAPGPLTLVMPAHPDLPRAVTAGLGTVAVRFPSHPVAIELLRACGQPVAAPSANRSGEPSPTTVAMARASLGDAVEWYLDGGPCEVGLESTVATVVDDVVTILRPGAVTDEDILAALEGVRVVHASIDGAGPSPSPGLRHRHYQPRARVVTVEFDDIHAVHPGSLLGPIGVLGLSDHISAFSSEHGAQDFVFREASDSAYYARNLYRWFAELDELGVRSIIAVVPRAEGIGRALRDRLFRASGGHRLG